MEPTNQDEEHCSARPKGPQGRRADRGRREEDASAPEKSGSQDGGTDAERVLGRAGSTCQGRALRGTEAHKDTRTACYRRRVADRSRQGHHEMPKLRTLSFETAVIGWMGSRPGAQATCCFGCSAPKCTPFFRRAKLTHGQGEKLVLGCPQICSSEQLHQLQPVHIVLVKLQAGLSPSGRSSLEHWKPESENQILRRIMRKILGVLIFLGALCCPKGAPAQVPNRVNCGGPSYTDSRGQVWAADYGYNEGTEHDPLPHHWHV